MPDGMNAGTVYSGFEWRVKGQDEVVAGIRAVGATADTSAAQVTKKFGGLNDVFAKAGNGLKSLVSGLGAIGLAANGLKAVASGFAAITQGMTSANAEFEQYQVQLSVLLGGMDNAKARMAELTDFAKKTPFELPGIMQAEKVLQSFGMVSASAKDKYGKDAMEIRTIAGDVAAGVGISYDQMATYLGRFSAGATGEVISRFQELGIVTRDTMRQMGIEFDNAGKMLTPANEATALLLQSMQDKYGGMMSAQSATLDGMMSNLSDWWWNQKQILMEPIFDTAKEGLSSLLAALDSPAIQEASYAWNAGLSMILDGATSLATQGVAHIQGFGTGFVDHMSQTADSALTWGFNIVAQLAGGIMDGLGSVLTGAMDAISGMLSWFLAPGSPPRVAPDIDKWGAAAMGEFLQGMTAADFDILEGIQRPMKSVLDLVFENTADAEDAYQRLTKTMAEGLTDEGYTQEALDKLRASAGEYGDVMVKLAEAQGRLKAPMEELNAAKEQLDVNKESADVARDAYEQERDKLAALKAAKAGSVEIKAQQAIVDEKKAAYDAENEIVKSQQKVVNDAQKKVLAIEKEVMMQQRILDQLTAQGQAEKRRLQAIEQMEKAQARMAKGLKKSMAGIGDGIADSIKGAFGDKKLDKVVTGKIDGWKTKIREALFGTYEESTDGDMEMTDAGYLTPVLDAWDEVKGKWDEVKTSFQTLKENAVGVFEAILPDDTRTTITEFANKSKEIAATYTAGFIENLGKLAGVILAVGLAIKGVSIAVGIMNAVLNMSPLGWIQLALFALIGVIALLKTAWDNDFGGMRTTITEFWEGTAKPALEALWLLITETLWPKLQEFAADAVLKFTEFGETVRVFWEEKAQPALQSLHDKFLAIKTHLEQGFKKAWAAIHSKMTEVRDWIVNNLLPKLVDMRTRFEEIKTKVVDLKDKILEFMNSDGVLKITDWFKTLPKLIEEAFNWFGKLIDKIGNAIQKLWEWFSVKNQTGGGGGGGDGAPPSASSTYVRPFNPVIGDGEAAVSSMGVMSAPSVASAAGGEEGGAASAPTGSASVSSSGSLSFLDGMAQMFSPPPMLAAGAGANLNLGQLIPVFERLIDQRPEPLTVTFGDIIVEITGGDQVGDQVANEIERSLRDRFASLNRPLRDAQKLAATRGRP